ncbi:MAG: acetyl-CoA carboxylase, biotin carboxyl carrier protein, partial [Candidatus Omnitrophica bacterium]|nr:acetyl-CoA carboxylase, biotin carboxyl carrier protein [Candidatus Omnitrophota bacterium]
LMNEIKSEVTGKIVNIPVENGEAIEFGQHLFELEVV